MNIVINKLNSIVVSSKKLWNEESVILIAKQAKKEIELLEAKNHNLCAEINILKDTFLLNADGDPIIPHSVQYRIYWSAGYPGETDHVDIDDIESWEDVGIIEDEGTNMGYWSTKEAAETVMNKLISEKTT